MWLCDYGYIKCTPGILDVRFDEYVQHQVIKWIGLFEWVVANVLKVTLLTFKIVNVWPLWIGGTSSFREKT